MSTTAYEASIGLLCHRLDELARGVSEEFAFHQKRVAALREAADELSDPTEVRGAVMTSALTLLEAVEGLNSQVAEVREIILEQQKLLESLHAESRTDALTGRLNRRAFDEEFARRISETKRTDGKLGLVLMDIDRFKVINDTYGHAAGDKVLKGVANVLTNSLRDMDVVARYGGEEFALILPSTSLLNSCRAAERARGAVASSVFRFEDHELSVTISGGVALATSATSDELKRADEALYAAKQAGRNCIFTFEDGSCQPLHREPVGEHGEQRRRWMRFLVEGLEVQLRCEEEPWQIACVKDESLTGLGVELRSDVSLPVGAFVEINYCGDLRKAEVKSVVTDADGQAHIGLQWCNTSNTKD